MAWKDPSLISEMLCLSAPWSGSLSFYSVKQRFMGFTIDYSSPSLICPLCGEYCDVIGKRIMTWKAPDLLDYETRMTAHLPIIGYHNFNCKVDHEKDLLGNTLLLDLILRQMSFIDYTNPFVQLFSATEVSLSN